MTLFQLIQRFIRRHWTSYLFSALMLAVVALLTVWIPRLLGQLVDALVNRQLSHPALLHGIGQLLLMGLAIYLLRVGWRQMLYSTSYRLGAELRLQLYQRLCAQGPYFFQQQRTGDLMALATNDIDAVEMAAGEALLAGFDGTLTLIMVLVMMAIGVDWRLTLVALLPFPLMAWAFWHISNRIHLASSNALSNFSSLNDHVQETLSGVRTVRALGLEKKLTSHFAELAESAAQSAFRAQKWEAAYEPAVGFTLTIATTLTLGLGSYLIWHQSLTIGAMTTFTMYLGQLIWPMFAAGWVLAIVQRGRAAWARLHPILDTKLSVANDGTLDALPAATISLDKVSLHYPGQAAPAISDLTLDIPRGATLGIVGPTGAGKSSILRLLMRQFSPSSGDIRCGEHALAEYRIDALRKALAWVPQESFLFSASIAENIALARPDASRDEIERVAKLAAIHDDILRFPQGYETPVGERGVTLSGGQRQRVAIARALLADAPILLLDDALSAVDMQTEAEILQHLRQTRQGRTVLIVSHRLSAVADADHIIVLKNGHLTESGNHSELLQQNGWYASQWRYQQLKASLDAL